MSDVRVSHELLVQLLDYDAATGIFRWKIDRGGSARKGTVAGSTDSKGYRQIKIHGRLHLAHRLAWLYVTGEWPLEQIDHRDRVHSNNRFLNLRRATHAQNQQNSGVRSDNESGMTGVSFYPKNGKWRAAIGSGLHWKHLGFFDSKERAGDAYRAAKARLHTFHPVQNNRRGSE